MTPEIAAAAGAVLVTKEELFRQADVVTIHLILSKRTRGLVCAADLALMKPTSWLINTSRGPIVDDGALVRVLTSRAIAGTALDVFDIEPLPAGHPSGPRTMCWSRRTSDMSRRISIARSTATLLQASACGSMRLWKTRRHHRHERTA